MEGRAIPWPIIRREEQHDVDIPYVQVSPMSYFKRSAQAIPNPLLRLTKATRARVFDTTIGRYVCCKVRYMGVLLPDDGFTDDKIIVHPQRDVITFVNYDRMELTERYINIEADLISIGRKLVLDTRQSLPPYCMDQDRLQAFISHTGLRFRHFLIRDIFKLRVHGQDVGQHSPWVLIHLCTHDNLRAHDFELFMRCSTSHPFVPHEADDTIDAKPFFRTSRSMGFYPMNTKYYELPVLSVPPIPIDYECLGWREEDSLHIDRPEIIRMFELLVIPEASEEL